MIDIKSYGSFVRFFGQLGEKSVNRVRKKKDISYIDVVKDGVKIAVDGLEYQFDLLSITVNGVPVSDEEDAVVKLTAELSSNTSVSGNNVSGIFTSSNNKTITVTNGLITQILDNSAA